MNSAIQILCHTPYLTPFLLKYADSHAEDFRSGTVTGEFMSILRQIWSGNHRLVNPTSLKKVVDAVQNCNCKDKPCDGKCSVPTSNYFPFSCNAVCRKIFLGNPNSRQRDAFEFFLCGRSTSQSVHKSVCTLTSYHTSRNMFFDHMIPSALHVTVI